MEIRNVENVDVDGYSGLAVTIEEDNGVRREALFTTDLKRTILDNHNAVFLGNEFVEEYHVVLPEDKADNRSETRLDGFSDDPKIVELIREWLRSFVR